MADLKLVFSAEYKDFDRMQKMIADINREMMETARAAEQAGKGFDRSFGGTTGATKGLQEFAASFGRIRDILKSRDFLEETTASIKKLGDVLGPTKDKMLGAFGDAAQQVTRRLSREVDELTNRFDRMGTIAGRIEQRASEAESRGDQDRARRLRERAGGYYRDQATIGLARDQIQDEMLYGGVSPVSAAMGFGRRAQGNLASGFGRFGAFQMGAIAGAAGGERIFAGLGGMAMSPYMTQAAEVAYRMRAGQEALAGDPTLMMLRGAGVGAEADLMNNAGPLGIFKRLQGGFSWVKNAAMLNYKSLDQIQIEQLQDAASASKAAYAGFGEASRLQLSTWRNFDDVYRSMGVSRGGAAVQGATAISSLSMMAPFMNALIGSGTDASMSRQRGLYDAQYRWGGSPDMIKAMAMRYAMGGDAAGEFSGFMGMTGMGTLAGRRAATTYAAQMWEQGTPTFGLDAATAFYGQALTATSGMQNVAEPVRATVAADLTQRVSNMATSAGNLLNASTEMALIGLGVSNPIDRYNIANLMVRDPSRAVRLAVKLSGKPEEEVRNKLNAGRAGYMGFLDRVTGGTQDKRKQYEDVGVDFTGMTLGGKDDPKLWMPGTRATVEALMPLPAGGGAGAGRPADVTAMEDLERAAGRREGAMLGAVGDLKDDLIRAVRDGLREGAVAAAENVDKYLQEQKENDLRGAARARTTSGAPPTAPTALRTGKEGSSRGGLQ